MKALHYYAKCMPSCIGVSFAADDVLWREVTKGAVQQEMPNDEADADSCAKLVDRVRIELEAERNRLDAHEGLQAMVEVTGRFSCQCLPRKNGPEYYDAEALADCIEFTNPLKRQSRIQEWPTLANILTPDPRATSTYAAINK